MHDLAVDDGTRRRFVNWLLSTSAVAFSTSPTAGMPSARAIWPRC